jgi:hypothetical protein
VAWTTNREVSTVPVKALFAATKWGTKRYLQMNRLAEIVAIA